MVFTMKHMKLVMISLAVIIISYIALDALYPRGPQLVGNMQSTGQASIGGPFTLTDMQGNIVTEKSLENRYSLIYFGFTNCPDICPTSLQTIALTMEALPKAQADQIQPIFITLDPERDKFEQLKEYLTYFHPRFWGFTGTEQQIRQAAKSYRVYYKIPDHAPGEDYAVDHSGYLYLMGPDGQFITHFSHDTTDVEMRTKLQEIL